MKQFNIETGKKGEEIARRHLRKKRYRIVETNFRTRYGELDIICVGPLTGSGRAALVFVEVKTKISEDKGTPEEMVSKAKLSQVTRTAQAYLLNNPKISKKYPSYRIDVVAIVLNSDGSVLRLDHYENVGMDLM